MRTDRSSLSTEQLLQQVERNSRGRKAGPMRELLTRTAILLPEPARSRLLACGNPIRGRTERGGLRKGRFRCGLTSCSSCQERAAKKASVRAWSLIQSVAGPEPDRKQISFVTVNSADRDLPGFKKRVRAWMRKMECKAVAYYSVSLNGMLHTHMVVWHPSRTRLELKREAYQEFGRFPVVMACQFKKKQPIQDGVMKVISYSYMPVKAKDFRRQPHLRNADSLAMFVVWDAFVTGKRYVEIGFSREERGRAELIRDGLKVSAKKPKKRKSGLILAKLRLVAGDAAVDPSGKVVKLPWNVL